MKSSRIFSLLAVCALFFHVGCAQSVPTGSTRYEHTHQIQQASAGRYGKPKISEEELLRTAYRYIGVPYRVGGSTPRGFDCSGFVSYIYKKFDIKIPRTSTAQYNPQRRIHDNKNLKVGDLVFFSGRRVSQRIGHVGIVSKVDPASGTFAFIHSASSGVQETSSEDPYYKKRFLKACAGPLR